MISGSPLSHSRQSERLEGANCLGSHRISAHFGRREINNIIDRSLCDVLQRFLGEKSLMSRNHDVWKGEQPRKNDLLLNARALANFRNNSRKNRELVINET